MSKLVICEKPSVAKSIASALGVTSRADGYFEGGGWLISWCIGHLVGLADAAAYDDRYKKWRYEDLPILPGDWRTRPPTMTAIRSGGMRTFPSCPPPSTMWCPRKRLTSSTFSVP